ncbi:calcium-binding protein [Candidatus Gracilibacteria bacterium]|nr:calcium-binding protein [Candidatus Gracilibacteria bacterium]
MYGDFDTAADGTGNDYLDGGNGSDSLIGGGGSDTLWGGDSNEFDFLVGGKGSDYLYGQAGGDYLQGGADTDYVDGGTGNDVLRGDSASLDNNLFQYDTLTGGTGADTFYLFNFSPNGGYGVSYLGAGYATITDFKYWEGDKFEVTGSLSDYSLDKSFNYTGGSALDTAIFYQNDLIAIAQDVTNIVVSLDFVIH